MPNQPILTIEYETFKGKTATRDGDCLRDLVDLIWGRSYDIRISRVADADGGHRATIHLRMHPRVVIDHAIIRYH